MKQAKQLRGVRIRRSSPHSRNAYNPAAYDDNMQFLVGWPGYRTSNGKSGLGYLESQAELAHMQGLMIRWLFTGQFRTYNPFYLLGMILIGLFYGVIPVVLIFHELLMEGNWSLLLLLVVSPNIAIGLLLILNAILSLMYWKQARSITGN